MSYYSKKIKQIKKRVRKIKYPLVYEPKKWKFVRASSYSYALDISVNDSRKKVLIPGCISNEILSKENKPIYNSNELMRRIKKDLKFLDIDYRHDDGIIWDDETRIAIYYKYTSLTKPIKYRFIRQDSNGQWSEWKEKIRKIEVSEDKIPDLSGDGFKLAEVIVLHE